MVLAIDASEQCNVAHFIRHVSPKSSGASGSGSGDGADQDRGQQQKRRQRDGPATPAVSGGSTASASASGTASGDDGSGPGGTGPNLVMVPVFVEPYRSTLLYRVALFAARRIIAFEELTCDFAAVR